MTHTIFTKTIQTPIGNLLAGATDKGICFLFVISAQKTETTLKHYLQRNNAVLQAKVYPLLVELEIQLTQYFKGKRKAFDLPLDISGTYFQQKVWQALRTIPYGETISYAQQAMKIGKPTAMRAVANANGKNPLMILIPCHRVIAANGLLGGFAGGVENKAFLLNLEKSVK